MAHPRRFRFGVYVGGLAPGRDWAPVARGAQDLGYQILLVPDHLNGQLSPVPALAAAAAVTSTLRVGTYVLANDLRHPLLLARDAATLDIVSGGRFELGLGAGWWRIDYDPLHLPLEPAGTRIDRLAEALALLRGALTEPAFGFAGKYYTVDTPAQWPRPVQPRLPFLVGGGGRRVLSLAARHADIVSVNVDLRGGTVPPLGDAAAGTDAAGVDRQLRWIREAAGSRYPELEVNVMVLEADVGPDAARAGRSATGGSPQVLRGGVDEVVDVLQERRDRWDISYVAVPVSAIVDFAPVVARLAGT
jgi:probable F420-dependent oxidoreductase